MLSAAPPRASPSIFVSTSPVTGSSAWNASATLHRLLAGHRVDDEQHLGRVDDAGDPRDLLHHRVVDVEAAGGVEDHDVEAARPAPLRARSARPRAAACRPARVWTSTPIWSPSVHELVDGRRAVDVGGHEERPLPLLAQADGELRGGRRLARALEADEHQDRRLRVETEPMPLAAEDRDELVVDDLDDLLAGIHAAEHVRADARARGRGRRSP